MEIKYSIDLYAYFDRMFEGIMVDIKLDVPKHVIEKIKNMHGDLRNDDFSEVKIKNIDIPLNRDIIFLEEYFVDVYRVLNYVRECESDPDILLERIVDYIDAND